MYFWINTLITCIVGPELPRNRIRKKVKTYKRLVWHFVHTLCLGGNYFLSEGFISEGFQVLRYLISLGLKEP